MSERIEQFRERLEAEPENDLLLFGFGMELARAGRLDEAIEPFRKLVSVKPGFSAAYRELGKILAGAGRTDEAREVYRKGIEVAEAAGDLQTLKVMKVFLARLDKPPQPSGPPAEPSV